MHWAQRPYGPWSKGDLAFSVNDRLGKFMRLPGAHNTYEGFGVGRPPSAHQQAAISHQVDVLFVEEDYGVAGARAESVLQRVCARAHRFRWLRQCVLAH